MFGAQKRDQLGDLILGERVFEAGHLLSAVFDLCRNLSRLQGLANVGQRRSFLCALSGGSMAIGATLVAKQSGSLCFRSFRSGSKNCFGWEKYNAGESQSRKQT